MALFETNHVPEGEFSTTLERLGLRFGPDTNASTGSDATAYILHLQETDPERGLNLGERRSPVSFQLRHMIDQLGFQIPETPYPNRLPIGTEEVLKTASAATMQGLYQRYYRPENATLVIVGDFDSVEMESKIKAKFSDWKGVGAAGPELPHGRVDLKRASAVDTFTDPAIATTVTMTLMRPWEDPADTISERRRL